MARGTWGGALDRHPYKVRISWTDDVHILQTGFTLMSVGANVSSPEEAANAVLPWVDEKFKTLLLTTQRIAGIDVVDLTNLEGFAISPGAMVGTRAVGAASQVPSALAYVVSMKGELRARYGQGRMFWPIVTDNDFDGDLLSAAGIAAAQDVIDDLAARFIGNTVGGHNLVNVHGVIPARAATPTRPARDEVPPSWYDVTSLRLRTVVTFLRSRKAGVGS